MITVTYDPMPAEDAPRLATVTACAAVWCAAGYPVGPVQADQAVTSNPLPDAEAQRVAGHLQETAERLDGFLSSARGHMDALRDALGHGARDGDPSRVLGAISRGALYSLADRLDDVAVAVRCDAAADGELDPPPARTSHVTPAAPCGIAARAREGAVS